MYLEGFTEELMLLNCGAGEDSWELLVLQRDQMSQSWRKVILNIHWKDWCWSSNTTAKWCEELTHWKRPHCWKSLRARGEEGDIGWDSHMASLTQWTWIWANSGRWWRTGKAGTLQPMGLQRAGHDWATEQQQQIYSNQNSTVLSEKQTHGSVEQKWEPRNKPTCVWSIHL